jgi:hypothetical protein
MVKMSDHRKPIASFTKRVAENQGNKTCIKSIKIEIFPAYFFSDAWEPGSNSFVPKPPLKSSSRKKYWEMNFRVRVDGSWYPDGDKYNMFTKKNIMLRWLSW